MRASALSTLGCLFLAATAAAQSTAFTYQGELTVGGQPASGPHDLRFTLFNVASGGVQVAPPQCVDNVPVTGGRFTLTLDFGQQFATADARFLQIQARADTGLSCANSAGLVLLGPRQALTAAPLASHAKSAFALAAADGTPASAMFVDAEGRVGIGTVSPQAPLQVVPTQGGATPGEGIRINGTSESAINQSYLSFTNGAGAVIGYVGDGSSQTNHTYVTSIIGDVLLYTPFGETLRAAASGNVGIGRASPGARLDIQGNDGSNILFGRRTGGGLAHNMFIDGAGNGSMQFLDATATPRINLGSGNSTYFNYGNVGIGTITPVARLDVRGDIRLGPSGQYRAPAAEENLRMLRATVRGDASIAVGAGLSVSRVSQGDYLVTFATPFVGTPTVTVTVDDEAESLMVDLFAASVYQASQGSVRVRIRATAGPGVVGGPYDRRFNIIAIGAR